MPSLFPSSTPATEVDLVRRLLARDETAMRDFYDGYSPTLYRLIRAVVTDAAGAEDVLQDSMVKIWRSFASYDPARGRLYAWAARLCHNQAIDYLRQLQVRGGSYTREFDDEPTVRHLSAESFNPEHLDVHACLTYLRPAYQRVLQLRFFDGFTFEEVAELLDLPLGTVKTHQRQALRKLAGLWR